LTGLASRTVRELTLAAGRDHLASRAKLAARIIAERGARDGKLEKAADLDPLVDELGALAGARITVVTREGVVLGDSDEDPAAMVNHAERPEIKTALSGEVGSALRWSATVGKEMLYVALPPDPALGGAVVRTATPSVTIGTALSAFSSRLLAAAIAIGALGAALALVLSRRVIRPLEDLEVAAARFAAGDLSFRAPATGSEETAHLAQSFNQMASQLDERFRAIAEQRSEQEAVLSSMVEGVLAVDADERVTTMNLAAGRLLGIEPHRALGRSIQEVTRNADIQKFVSNAGRSEDVVECEITLHGPDVRVIQGHGARIRDSRGRRIGTVVVLNNITRMRHLETLRRDFVANVSHELKTPITSIKGFVATLLDGAMDNPQDARRFLEIVARHADRLSSIIDDLLSLSRIEQEDQGETLETARSGVRETVKRAMDTCAETAADRQIRLELDCSEALVGVFNARLVEQAVTNLIDNAIKYSDPGSPVEIAARRVGHATEVAVRDHGVGIEAQHLDRLFERFYRVDKARSRKLGGTGLGLAIVKHIASSAGGHVLAEHTEPRGLTIRVVVPEVDADEPRLR
jgi:two-component system phosphate regulon sensor histidine kinase PhoR